MVLAALGSRYITELNATMRRIIDSSLQSADREAPDFGTMLRYPLGWVDELNHPYAQPTGKRIRPLLLLLCTEATGGDWQQALPAAAAVEFLHNFSLIHDDIEDNSETRHGRPTVWKLWGLPNALNAGDAMFALAYVALEHLTDVGVAPDIVIKVLKVFSQTNLELTRGQHLDMGFEKRSVVTTDEYLSMIRGKSAALVAACAHIGALIGSNDDGLAGWFGNFGLNLGIAFQIRDDILGIWGDPGVTGKSAATDILSRKKSLPVLFGLQNSTRLAEIYQQATLTQEDVTDAVKLLDGAGALSFARETEEEYYRAALNALQQTQLPSEAVKGLAQLAETLFERSA